MECSICYMTIEPNQIKTLSCSHYFHETCVTSWINTQINSQVTPSCPMCRCNTITDILFEENDDDLPALIPIIHDDEFPELISLNSPINIIPSIEYTIVTRNEMLKMIVSRYAYYLNKVCISIDSNDIDYLVNTCSYIKNKYKNEFMEYIDVYKNFTEPDVFDHEVLSLNTAKSTGYLAHLNWWMNKANTFNQIIENEEKKKCIMMTEIIACHHAINDN